MIIFAYRNSETSVSLYEDGTLICISEGRTAAFSVVEESMFKIRRPRFSENVILDQEDVQ